MSQPRLRVALVGLGYWGPNLLRAAADLDDLEVAVLCDLSQEALATHGRRYPAARLTQSLDDVLEDESIDAVVVATPVKTHFEIAKRALQAGKHVFVEKPLTTNSLECVELIRLATDNDLILMPGHTFLYSSPVVAIKDMLDTDALGEIYFATSTRVNLGIHRSESNVIQDLAPHDFSILHYWLGRPTFARAIARDSVVPGLWDVAFVDLGYATTGTLVRVELSWLAPTKLRRTVLAGRKAMVVYDDTSNEPLRIFDRGAEVAAPDVAEPHNFGEHRMSYRIGDVISPHLSAEEPLRLELADFAASMRSGAQPRSNMQLGLEVVQMMEAAEASLLYNGAPVQVVRQEGDRRMVPDRRSMFSTFKRLEEEVASGQSAPEGHTAAEPQPAASEPVPQAVDADAVAAEPSPALDAAPV